MSEPKDYISAYKWDYYCEVIYKKVYSNIDHIKWELGELYDQNPCDLVSLLHYYKKWHYNKELYQLTQKEAITRKYVIENMLERGYGVNIDLACALDSVEQTELPELNKKLGETFYRKLEFLQTNIFMPQEHIDYYNSLHVISCLCEKLNYPLNENIPIVPSICPDELDFYSFFQVKNRSRGDINSAVFKKMFLTLGETSKTIMKGTIGYENFYSPQYLKTVAANNFINLFHDIYSTSFDRLEINLDFLRKIHYVLYENLDTPYTCNPGEFRTFDFEDKNGTTVKDGKLIKELMILEGYFQKMDWYTGDLYKFIRGLSEIYHLIIAIHPFSDANGRVAKCFVNYIMVLKGLMPVIFDDEEEILSLPRYGSSLIDIEAYFKNRIAYSIDYYLRETRMIEKINCGEIVDAGFDSAFHFRRFSEVPVKIEVKFSSYIISDPSSAEEYVNECRIVFPDEHSLYNMKIYCGLSYDYNVWEREINISPSSIEEIDIKKSGIRKFEVTLFLALEQNELNYKYIEFSIVCSVTGRFFNNKSLNYAYRLSI